MKNNTAPQKSQLYHQETTGLYIFLHMDRHMSIFLFCYIFMAAGSGRL